MYIIYMNTFGIIVMHLGYRYILIQHNMQHCMRLNDIATKLTVIWESAHLEQKTALEIFCNKVANKVLYSLVCIGFVFKDLHV